jgi:hypothetical protein
MTARSRPSSLAAVALAVAASLVTGSPARPAAQPAKPWPTLREVLARHDVKDVRGLPQDVLDLAVTGCGVDDGGREAFVACFQADGTLRVALMDRTSGGWRHAKVVVDDAQGAGNSIVAVTRTRRFFYLESHINPSAGRLLVVSRDLTLRRAIYGWAVATLPTDVVVYHRSQVHFAPTHSLELSVFDAATLQDKPIYPPRPFQPVRKAFIDRVAQAYESRGEAWFRDHNHHMDPERFDSSLDGPVTTDAIAKTVSFHVRYGDPDNANDPLPFGERVAVTCGPIDRIDRLRCREVGARGPRPLSPTSPSAPPPGS